MCSNTRSFSKHYEVYRKLTYMLNLRINYLHVIPDNLLQQQIKIQQSCLQNKTKVLLVHL